VNIAVLATLARVSADNPRCAIIANVNKNSDANPDYAQRYYQKHESQPP
jgi:hypothetical protein